VVRSGRSTGVELTLIEQKELSPRLAIDPSRRPVGDVRSSLDPVQWREGPSFEVGGGIEQGPYRLSGHVRLLPTFGLGVRGALVVPVANLLNGNLEVELPVVFLDLVAVGIGGSGGIEYLPSKWFSLFAQLGGKHYFTGTNGYERNRFTLQAGVRLRPP
jgi:hypothetical protein